MRPVAGLTSTLPSAHVRASRGAATSCASQSGAGVASEFSTHTHGAEVTRTPPFAPPAKPVLRPSSSTSTCGWWARSSASEPSREPLSATTICSGAVVWAASAARQSGSSRSPL